MTLNDPAFVEAARALAKRMQASDTPPRTRLAAGYSMALAEPPSAGALRSLVTLYEDAMAYYGANPSDAARLGGDAATQELAALTLAANTILNLDGFVMKE